MSSWSFVLEIATNSIRELEPYFIVSIKVSQVGHFEITEKPDGVTGGKRRATHSLLLWSWSCFVVRGQGAGHGRNNLIGICLLKQWSFVLGGKTTWIVPTSHQSSPGVLRLGWQITEIVEQWDADPGAEVRIQREFLNCIFCEGRYYNTMHYITLGGRMSGTMSGIIESVITTGWSRLPPPAITWNVHYTHQASPGSPVLLLLYHPGQTEIFTAVGSLTVH